MADNQCPPTTAESDRAEASMIASAKAILDDALELIKQQITLLKVEIRTDVHNLVASVIPLAFCVLPMILGGLMLCFALVHLLHWATLPATTGDAAAIPLWGCYAIVSAAFLLTGIAFAAVGLVRLRRVYAVPHESVRALEENIRWLMNKNPK
jgi:hypothetical protein